MKVKISVENKNDIASPESVIIKVYPPMPILEGIRKIDN